MDSSFADIAVHLTLLLVTVWAVLGNPGREPAQRVGDTLHFPLMSRARIALLVAAAALGWRTVVRWQAGGGVGDLWVPALLALALIGFWLMARVIVVDDKGVHQTRLFGNLRSSFKWSKIARAEVMVRRRGGRQRVLVRVMNKQNEAVVVHSGATVDPKGFVEELGRRGVKIVEKDD